MLNFQRVTKLIGAVSLVVLLLSALPGGSSLAPTPLFAAGPIDSGEEIVYVGSDDCIRVLDPYQTGGTAPNTNPEIKFESNKWECGWRDVALGDFNNDGDMEIVAVGGDSSTGKLAVFDPVMASSTITPDFEFNGIPAKRLFRRDIPEGKPILVGAGNLDAGIPGDEIFYTIDLNNDSDMKVVILKPTSLTPDGMGWATHIEGEFGSSWDEVAIGNIDNVGTDEVILVDESGEMGAYRPVGNFSRFFRFSDSSPWRSAAIGQVYSGGPKELVAARDSESLASLFIFQYANDSFSEATDDAMPFAPYPRHVFLADVNGSGDDEVLFLRRDSSARLIMRNRGTDGTIKIELPLDSDNGYEAGAGGDLKGDNRDMIVIARDNNIRIYTEPHLTVDDASIRNFGLTTNSRSLVIGDLDKNGVVTGPEFRASPSSLTVSLPQESYVSQTFTVKLENIGTSESLPFTISPGHASWVTVTADRFTTPANLSIVFDATGLSIGAYTTNVTIDTTNTETVNRPFKIPLTLNVSNARVDLSLEKADFMYYPCSQYDPNADNVRTVTIDVGGTAGVKYTAAVLELPALAAAAGNSFGRIVGGSVSADSVILYDDAGNSITLPREQFQPLGASAVNDIAWPSGPAWVTSVSSKTGVIRDTIEIEVDPSQLTQPFVFEQAPLILVAGSNAGYIPDNIRILPISIRCLEGVLFLPYLAR